MKKFLVNMISEKENYMKGKKNMAENKSKTTHGLQETKGFFELRGKVNGTEKERLFKESTTKSGKAMKIINFGAEVDKDKSIYLNLNGIERDKAFFSQTKDGKTTIESVPWKDRNSFKKDGFNLLGIKLGINKVIDKNGKEVNDRKNMTEFDACNYINNNLKDDMSIYARGKIEFSTYNDKHYTKYMPNQISLCKPVDFDADDFVPKASFEQVIIITGIDKTENGEFIVNAKIITYSTIEDVEFYLSGKYVKLAKSLRKLPAYTAIKVFGTIVIEQETDTVDDDDDGEWGDPNPMEHISKPVQRKLYITGADKNSIDSDLYSEEAIEAAIAKINAEKKADSDFGSSSDDDGEWGTVGSGIGDDDSDIW